MVNATKKLGMILAAGLVTGTMLTACGGGDDGGKPATGNTSTSGSAGTASGGMVASGGGPGTPAGAGPGAMPGTAGAAGAATTAPPKNTTPPPGARQDPFRPWWDSTPPPPPVLTLVAPMRIAARDTVAAQVEPGIEIQESPSRRVAGILTGNGVYALIEGNGEQKIVRPGDVLDDGYRVTMINFNSVTLKKTVANQTFTQIVPLTDAGSVSVSGSAPGGLGGPGGPGGLSKGGPGMMGPGLGGGKGGGAANF